MFYELAESLKFKQDRTLLLVADPWNDQPHQNVNFEKFYDINLALRDTPVFVLVKAHERRVILYDDITIVTADDLAGFLFEYVFSDLARSEQQREREWASLEL